MALTENFLTLTNVQAAREALRTQGFLLIEEAMSPEVCGEIMRWMDAYTGAEGTEINYGGSELRIWDTQKKSGMLRGFWEHCNVFMSCLLKADTQAYTLLAIRNRPVSRDDAKLNLGRWHIDSFRQQFKIFLFLSEVKESTGPFEFIPRSHAAGFKLRRALGGIYFRLKDFLGRKRRYMRLDDEWITRIGTQGYTSTPVVCRPGTALIIDTSAIHRARPCLEGARYALTAYYH